MSAPSSRISNVRSFLAWGRNSLVPLVPLVIDPIFTERPFVRPLSRRGQLQSMFTYIKHNPQRLATKRLMPGFFRVQEGIDIADRSYSGVGNIRLLHNKCFAPVHVRSMWVKDAEQHGNAQPLRDYMNSCILSARQGTVMVSPFISPKEKEVLSLLLAEKHPLFFCQTMASAITTNLQMHFSMLSPKAVS